MAIERIPGVGPGNSDVANAVAAVVPTNASIQTTVQTYAGGIPGYILRQTITSSSNSISVPNNFVYAVVASGGSSTNYEGNSFNAQHPGSSGSVVFGLTPSTTRVTIGAANEPSAYGSITANFAPFKYSAANASIPEYGIGTTGHPSNRSGGAGYSGSAGSGGGGTGQQYASGAGGNSSFGYNGGAGAASSNNSGSGGGGGAGIAGNGNAGNAGNPNTNVPGNGGNGGVGGGGAGSPGNFSNNGLGNSGTPGSGAVLIYY